MPIVTRGGNILLRNGAIATSTACCCDCPCGQKRNASNVCEVCIAVPRCDSNILVEWQGITLPEDGCAWSVGGGDGPVYTAALQSVAGLIIPDGGFETVDGTCYMFGFVGTAAITNPASFEPGSCRGSAIIWKWRLVWVSCDSMAPGGPYTPTLSFHSGYKQVWYPGIGEEIIAISSAGEVCEPISQPAVTITFPP